MGIATRRGSLFIVALFVCLALPHAASAACTPTAMLAKYDDEAAMLGGGGGAFVQQSQWPAQSFAILNPSQLGLVSLFMQNLAPAGDTVTAEVRSDVGTQPGALLGQATASTNNTTSFDWLSFDFSALGIQLAVDTPYWIVASSSITSNGEGYGWQETAPSSAYSSGISRNSSTQGSSWGSPLNWDHGFRVQACAGAVTPPSTVPPTNAFSIGKLARNKQAGSATLSVNLPGPGTLSLSGKGVVMQRPALRAGILAGRAVAAAGETTVLIRVKNKRKVKLNQTGKAKVKVTLTYTPAGGVASSQTRKIRLKKSL